MERKGFIGGSDCVKIMQGNWLELWQIKTGLVESDDLSRNLAVQLGSYTEDFNLEWFEIEYDCILSNLQHEYELQLYAHLAKADGAYLSVIFGNNKWEAAYVDRDEKYFDSMWAVVSDFWGYVVRKQEPVGHDEPVQLSIDKIAVDNMVKRDANTDNRFVDAAVTYVNGYEKNRVFENTKKDLKAMVAQNEREVYCDYLTVKRDKRGSLRITPRKGAA